MVEELFGAELLTKDGPMSTVEAIGDVKVVFVYFSMHNCPPCRQFTPILAELYEEANADEKQFEVVFCSGDREEAQYNEYFGEMPWKSVGFKSKVTATLAKKFEVKGLPRMVVIRPNGEIIKKCGREQIINEGPQALEEFITEAEERD
jgi:thiol-disulfide isomerase/thioredoxin